MILRVSLGATPVDEPCVGVGEADYEERAMAECERFVRVIRTALGPPPAGAHLTIRGNAHDFGTYHGVYCEVEDGASVEAVEYALRCEGDAIPTRWPAGS